MERRLKAVLLGPVRHWDSPATGKYQAQQWLMLTLYDVEQGGLVKLGVKAQDYNASVLEEYIVKPVAGGKMQVLDVVVEYVDSGNVLKPRLKSLSPAEVLSIAKK